MRFVVIGHQVDQECALTIGEVLLERSWLQVQSKVAKYGTVIEAAHWLLFAATWVLWELVSEPILAYLFRAVAEFGATIADVDIQVVCLQFR